MFAALPEGYKPRTATRVLPVRPLQALPARVLGQVCCRAEIAAEIVIEPDFGIKIENEVGVMV